MKSGLKRKRWMEPFERVAASNGLGEGAGYQVKDRTRRAGSKAWCVIKWEIVWVDGWKV